VDAEFGVGSHGVEYELQSNIIAEVTGDSLPDDVLAPSIAEYGISAWSTTASGPASGWRNMRSTRALPAVGLPLALTRTESM
jgi:hypothetical protein